MPSWLVEDAILVAIVLGIGAILLLAAWLRDRDKRYLIAGAVLAVLAVVAAVIWFAVDTDARKIERKVKDMAAGIPRDLDRTFRHVSAQFLYGTDRDKRALRRAADDAVRQGNVTEIVVRDIHVEEADRQKGEAKVNFRFRIRGKWAQGGEFTFFCRSVFRLDEDGEWRLRDFKVYNPVLTNEVIPVPGL